ncbi:hypothetical protein BKA66DRAFT_415773 [Pyrenochaeta sp. MPI-SDFR-AT-0127]|nr:hypothetical protein BKA66DRAFT_415773 [Pyrenochaeta sp. MPI-SDFR-AT-0127]
MNFTAVFTLAEVEALSDPDKTYRDATRELERVSASLRIAADGDESDFEKGLKIKNTLDAFEGLAMTKPSWKVLAVLTNCEYRLWCLNSETPMRHNPFLSHWVEAYQRLHKDISEASQNVNTTGSANGGLTTEEIVEARTEWIKRLLPNKNMEEFLGSTPRELHHAVIKLGLRKPFDIQTYIQMLVEEGIYDRIPEPKVPAWKRKKEQHRNNASKQWKKDMLQKLREHPDVAVQELTRLPLELSYLDFLTTLLTDHTLEQLSIDPAPVINSYIQHSLRLVEQMEKPPTDSSVNDNTDGSVDHASIWEYGKEAQSRAVRLLLLFIKSLIRKELLGTEVLYFEIQEICVRYVWIKEVRDFRTWVEEGVGEDQAG